MLPPQVISAAHGSLALQNSLALTSAALRTQSALPRRSRPHRQIRTFRIGLWSSYLDPDYQKEAQRRQRIMRHKYFEALNRKLSWDRQLPSHIRHRGLKGFMCSAWYGREKRPGGRWIDMDEVEGLQASQKDKSSGIEEVEQTPVDRLLKNHNEIIQDMIRTRARLFGRSWYSSETSDALVSNSSTSSSQSKESPPSSKARERAEKALPSDVLEYEIDPITNRKVFKKRSSQLGESPRTAIDVPIHPFELYGSKSQGVSSCPQDPARESLKRHEREGRGECKPVYFMESPEKYTEMPGNVQAGLKAYDDTSSYGPVYYNEPDGKDPEIPCSVQEGLKEFDDKMTYGPVYYKEPDGRDPKKPCSVQTGLKEYDDTASYGPVYHNEPDGKDPEVSCSVQRGLRDYDAKTSYGPVYYKEPDGKDPEIICPVQRGLKDYDDKVSYGPLMFREPDGKALEKACSVRESLKEFDAKANYGSLKRSPLPASAKLRRPPPEERIEDLDLLRASDVRAAAGLPKASRKESESEKASKRQQLEADFRVSRKKFIEDLRNEHSEISNHVAHARGKVNAKIAEVEAGWPKSSKADTMTGNFVRDFPEEFSTTWSTVKSSSGSLLPDKAQELENKVQAAEKSFSDSLGSSEMAGQGPGTKRIQSSLDRNRLHKRQLDEEGALDRDGSQSKSAKILEEQKRLNLVREVQQIYEEKYGTIDFNHRQLPEQQTVRSNVSPLAQPEIPTLYKILAYDPTMQSISEAETTSIVPDSASPLTPAEVLLRLSNPAKFFPHFAPLQSQGYEIVSGSGDVLVFRKVHSGAPPVSVPEEEPSFAKKEYKRLRRNPIDGMQPIAATGNFASPTGFVNYDLAEDQEQSEPPFKSNIDVRREETVFSGRSSWQDGEEPSSKKKGRGKRLLIGAFWVGACSYAVGVVAEYFRTGGLDGMGPKGF